MITKEQLINEINHRFCVANGWDEELRTEREKTALVEDLMQNGESLDYGNGVVVTTFLFDEHDKRNCGLSRIMEYARPVFDEDGDIEDWQVLGYDIDGTPIE